MSPVDAASITAVDWQVQLGAPGEIVEGADDIDQCIRTILLTPKGSIPHDPDFGSNLHLYIDWPLQIARPQMIREAIDAIHRNEPRAVLTRLSVEAAASEDPALIGSIVLEVEWTAKDSTSPAQSTAVVVGTSA
jgi:Bacteriophage baseplate protein W